LFLVPENAAEQGALPAEMTISGRTYGAFDIRADGELLAGPVLVERAEEMDATLGSDDVDHLLRHQGEIPRAFGPGVVFAFFACRCPEEPEKVAYLNWDSERRSWLCYWTEPRLLSGKRIIVLHRKAE